MIAEKDDLNLFIAISEIIDQFAKRRIGQADQGQILFHLVIVL